MCQVIKKGKKKEIIQFFLFLNLQFFINLLFKLFVILRLFFEKNNNFERFVQRFGEIFVGLCRFVDLYGIKIE